MTRLLFFGELDLVRVVAKQVSRLIRTSIDFDELLAAGREGLFDAALRFQPNRGTPFRVYATYRVEGAMIDAFRKTTCLPRRSRTQLDLLDSAASITEDSSPEANPRIDSWGVPDRPARLRELAVATDAGSSVTCADFGTDRRDFAEELAETTPEEAYARAELIAVVQSAIKELGETESRLLNLYYFEDKSYESVAKVLSISRPMAHRLHSKVVKRLAKRLRSALQE
ncbi:MAG: sigma-70 family RNA polymerase sigma factor [Myxococcales bacterium]